MHACVRVCTRACTGMRFLPETNVHMIPQDLFVRRLERVQVAFRGMCAPERMGMCASVHGHVSDQ